VGIRYLADKIYGFPAGVVTLMPMTGTAETEPAKYAAWYDHDLETATPYYYAGIFDDFNIEVEYTVSEHAAYYRLTFPAGRSKPSIPQGSLVARAGLGTC
jgi:putative alpha-1,2-mannosidase